MTEDEHLPKCELVLELQALTHGDRETPLDAITQRLHRKIERALRKTGWCLWDYRVDLK